MDYVYNYTIDTELSESDIKLICDMAVLRARLKAPIKTGNLRRSVKYKIESSAVMLYIDTTMYKVPYYEYVNEVHRKSGLAKSGNGYWYDVVAEFGGVLYRNLDKVFKEKIEAERKQVKDNEEKQAEIDRKVEEKNAEIKRRKEENERFTEMIKQLALLYAITQIGEQRNEKR